MSGKIIIEGSGPAPPPHRCNPPGRRGSIFHDVPGAISVYDRYWVGTLWLCECGKFWHCREYYRYNLWYQISPRKAQKMIKEANVGQVSNPE